jgi:CRISPR-associated protein Cas2
MAFYIAFYDVDKKRVAKMHKCFSKYLFWLQNSVFEGDLTDAQFNKLKAEIDKIMDTEVDSVGFFKVRASVFTERMIYGIPKPAFNNII